MDFGTGEWCAAVTNTPKCGNGFGIESCTEAGRILKLIIGKAKPALRMSLTRNMDVKGDSRECWQGSEEHS